mgnify:CR=1 FL=1
MFKLELTADSGREKSAYRIYLGGRLMKTISVENDSAALEYLNLNYGDGYTVYKLIDRPYDRPRTFENVARYALRLVQAFAIIALLLLFVYLLLALFWG